MGLGRRDEQTGIHPGLMRMMAFAGALVGAIGLVLPLIAVAAVGTEPALQVIGARLGVHAPTTRFVLEISGKVHFRAATVGDPYRVLVDLPEMVWPGAETAKSGLGLVRNYHLERLRPGATQLILETTGPARIRTAMVIPPSEGHQTRLVLDVESMSPQAFAQEQQHGRGGASPSSEAAFVPPPPPSSSSSSSLPPSSSPPARSAVRESPPLAPPTPLVPPPASPPMSEASSDHPEAQSDGPASAVEEPPPPVFYPSSAAPPLVSPRSAPPSSPPPPAPASPSPQAAASVPPAASPAKPHRGAPSGKPMIALDPGHGGVDPGATGYNGAHEKDITLATAREVRRQLEATGRYRVMMTRDEDEFIPLRERVARAREAGAQLFISLHADSIVGSQVRGMSIYTLSDKASDHEAETLAAKENRSDAIGGIDLSHENDQVATILIDLAQRDTRNHSHHFAGLVLHEVGRIQKLLPKPDRSAGFAVLTAPDVPSVLIEMGYLSSSEDVGLLTQADHRQRLAGALVRAIDSYFGWLGGGRRS
jgi:N-acetylmuramoyl-L-alanine amidase